jgi:hypothetical protein
MKKYITLICLLFLFFVGVFYYFYSTRNHVNVSPVVQTDNNTEKKNKKPCEVPNTDKLEIILNDFRVKSGHKPLVHSDLLMRFASFRTSGGYEWGKPHKNLQRDYNSWNMGRYYFSVGEDISHLPKPLCQTNYDWIYGFKKSEKHWTSLMNDKYDHVGIKSSGEYITIILGDLRY